MRRSQSPRSKPKDRIDVSSSETPVEIMTSGGNFLTRFSIYILWFEALINMLNGAVTLVDPALAMDVMTHSSSISAFGHEAGEAARWFAAVGIAFGGYLLMRVLLISDPSHRSLALKPLLEALLVGDVLYLSSLVPFAIKYSVAPGIYAPYVLTLIMFVARFYLRFLAPPAATTERKR